MNRPRRGNSRRPENSAQIRKATEKGRADLTRVVSPGCFVQSTKFATAIPAWGYAPSTMDADPAMPTRRIHVDRCWGGHRHLSGEVRGGSVASWAWVLVTAAVGLGAGIGWHWCLMPRRFPRLDPETGSRPSRLKPPFSIGAATALLVAVLLSIWSQVALSLGMAACAGWLLPRGCRPIYEPPLDRRTH